MHEVKSSGLAVYSVCMYLWPNCVVYTFEYVLLVRFLQALHYVVSNSVFVVFLWCGVWN